MDVDQILNVGPLVALALALGVLAWIAVDSRRNGYAATTYLTVAVATVVIALFGLAFVVKPDLLGDQATMTTRFMRALGAIAGAVSLFAGGLFALRMGLPAGTPAAAAPFDATRAAPAAPGVAARQSTAPVGSHVAPAGPPAAPALRHEVERGATRPDPSARPDLPFPAGVPTGPQATRPFAAADPPTVRVDLARPSHLAWLVFLDGPRAGATVQLDDDGFIGRSGAQCRVVLDDDAVSGLHARIRRQGEGFVLTDVGSTNGSYVNDEEVRTPRVLRDGDRVVLGATRLAFMEVVGRRARPDK